MRRHHPRVGDPDGAIIETIVVVQHLVERLAADNDEFGQRPVGLQVRDLLGADHPDVLRTLRADQEAVQLPQHVRGKRLLDDADPVKS
jgi:hypothetical protein